LNKINFLETIKVLDGKPCHIEYHQERYEAVFLAYGRKATTLLDQQIADVPKQGLYRCRVLYNLQEQLQISYHKYQKRRVTKLKALEAPDVVYDKKYADRTALERLFAKRQVCDDVLIMQNGIIKETSIANVAFLQKGVWYTPKEPLLRGTTRERLLRESRVVECVIRYADIQSYEAVALMNAMIDFDIIANKNIEDIIC
jgi:4-amino-4-deoxychorismate lyase